MRYVYSAGFCIGLFVVAARVFPVQLMMFGWGTYIIFGLLFLILAKKFK